MDFYQVFIEMCNKKGVAPSRAALDIGLSKTAVNVWKVKRSTPTERNSLTQCRISLANSVSIFVSIFFFKMPKSITKRSKSFQLFEPAKH